MCWFIPGMADPQTQTKILSVSDFVNYSVVIGLLQFLLSLVISILVLFVISFIKSSKMWTKFTFRLQKTNTINVQHNILQFPLFWVGSGWRAACCVVIIGFPRHDKKMLNIISKLMGKGGTVIFQTWDKAAVCGRRSLHLPSRTGLDCSSCSLTLFTSWPFPHTAATYDITSLLASGTHTETNIRSKLWSDMTEEQVRRACLFHHTP